MNNSRHITNEASFFLDSLRLTAAITVLIGHAHDMWFPNNPSRLPHAAVVLFFVLSGYVISYTTSTNNRGRLQYAEARLSRLYSIVFPSLIITIVIEELIRSLDHSLWVEFSRGTHWPRYLLCGLFLNEIWFLSAAPPVNNTLWSLSFEFWYYLIFGLFLFRRNDKSLTSYVLPIIACLIAGPKILLMMPIWLLGCVAYSLPKIKISRNVSWAVVFVCLLISILTAVYMPAVPYRISGDHLMFANQFLTDYVVGLSIFISLWNIPLGDNSNTFSKNIKKYRRIADLTFPIYVLHYPIILLVRSIVNFQPYDYAQLISTIVIAIVASSTIGYFLESKKIIWKKCLAKTILLLKASLIKSPSILKYNSHE